MKKIYKSRSGFTLVELLAVILIIGILIGISIVAVMKFIDKAREEQIASQEQTLIIAAQDYLQENRGLLPKNIGEITRVTATILKNNNYLTDDIKGSKKENCMKNTYVTAYKETNTKYVYKAYINCGDESTPEVAPIEPNIDIEFVDASGSPMSEYNNIAEKINEARYKITISGGTRDGKTVGIDGYSYSILVYRTGKNNLNNLTEEYSSGTINANGATDIVVEKDNNLKDHIDITGETTVAVKVRVRNLEGGIKETTEYLKDTAGKPISYQDNTPPECAEVSGEAPERVWMNIGSAGTERRITVLCDDHGGSGCIRTSFTKTWTEEDEVEMGVITIQDNAKKTRECKVRVNIDKKYPVINIDAFAKGKDNNSTVGSSVLTGTKTNENASDGSVVINSDEYSNLYNGYMNKARFPHGVIYKVTLKDGAALQDWTWAVNAKEIESVDDPRYRNVSLDPWVATDENDQEHTEAQTGSCDGKKECTFYVRLYSDGLRKGVLTVTDRAGNTSKYTIYAYINKQSPKITKIINSSSGTATGAWTKSAVTLTIAGSSKIPIADYYYSYDYHSEEFSSNPLDADSKWVKLSGGTGKTEFTTQSWDVEMNKKVYIIACDVAENCSDAEEDKNYSAIKIDRTAPTGMELTGYKKTQPGFITDPAAVEGLETVASDTWYKGRVVVIPSGATDSGSKGIYYKVSVTGASENTIDSVQGYRNVHAEGVSTVSFVACDSVNNCSMPSDFIVKLDRTGPTLPSIFNPVGLNWAKTDVTITIGSIDILAGIGKYYYSYTAEPEGKGTNPATQWVEMSEGTNKSSFEKTWSNDMNKQVYIIACDKVGNCSSVNNTVILIDNNPPTTPVITNPTNGDWTKTSFALGITSSDAGSGLADYQYTYNANATEVGDDADTQWKSDGLLAVENYTSSTISIERNQLMYWRACDALGNCSEKSSTRIRIDKTKPTCGTITTTTNDSVSGVSGTLACEDSGSTCDKDIYNFGPYTVASTLDIADKAGNTRECTINIVDYDCSTYSAWTFAGIFSPYSNSCSNDRIGWDYSFGTCSVDANADVCTDSCNSRCADPNNCDYVCCVRRRKTEKTCYRAE